MSLAKKGSRLITVDGVTYRWRVRGRPTYSQAIEESPLSFAVELADDPGSTLVVQLPQAHPGSWLEVPGTSAQPAVPADVERAIRDARAAGWSPANRGPAFVLDRAADRSE